MRLHCLSSGDRLSRSSRSSSPRLCWALSGALHLRVGRGDLWSSNGSDGGNRCSSRGCGSDHRGDHRAKHSRQSLQLFRRECRPRQPRPGRAPSTSLASFSALMARHWLLALALALIHKQQQAAARAAGSSRRSGTDCTLGRGVCLTAHAPLLYQLLQLCLRVVRQVDGSAGKR